MQIIGLTGGIASGKSTISHYLVKKGYSVIDADQIAHKLSQPQELAYQAIVAAFGSNILLPSGEIDRQKLGQLIFHDESKRELLNNVTHPLIHQQILYELDQYRQRGVTRVFVDVPLLFEAKFDRLCDQVWLVWVDAQTQVERLMQRDLIDEPIALAKIKSQMPLADKRALADVVIDNNGSYQEAYHQVDTLLEQI
ncbi:dephospho-CoA kinase [Vaginisenegalia massiliensis]|uniref:dephospho-CoA kinase n=1 Tax=Vaginisenegalia massiliensis TaxID=2058294 RepID=UPI000F53E821|nr:dephospho-CoA kinase [Vaginisenegalia massiliensis]